MDTFETVSEIERQDIMGRARAWREDHAEHVAKLLRSVKIGDYVYAPTGADMHRPELWKAKHWMWFQELEAA